MNVIRFGSSWLLATVLSAVAVATLNVRVMPLPLQRVGTGVVCDRLG